MDGSIGENRANNFAFFALQKGCNAPSSLSFSGDRKNSYTSLSVFF
jgi:hypothetical protein